MEESPVDRFLGRRGMLPEDVDVRAATDAFLDQMERGLRGQASPLLMLQTYLPTTGPDLTGRQALVVDAGGTNLRAACVAFSPGGPMLTWQAQTRMPGVDKPCGKAEFLQSVAELLAPAADGEDPLGFCFSFPAEILPDGDARVLRFNKEIQIPDAPGLLLGRELAAYLKPPHPTTVLNDTAAAALAGMDDSGGGVVGFILGTGTNTCCPVDGSLINTEAANFNGFQLGELERRYDAASALPGDHLYEKLVSGGYLGGLLRLTLRCAAEEGLLGKGFTGLPEMDMSQVNAFLQDPAAGPIGQACGGPTDRERAGQLCMRALERAARLVTANLSAALLRGGLGREAPARIVAEGSTFWRCDPYRACIQSAMEGYTGDVLHLQYQFVAVPHANLLGAARAALWSN